MNERRRPPHLIALAVLVSAVGATGARDVRVGVNAYGKRMLVLDGKSHPLFVARGVGMEDDLQDLKTLGLNTVWIPIPWTDAPLGKTPAGKLLRRCEQTDLDVIAALQTAAPPVGSKESDSVTEQRRPSRPQRFSPADEAYVAALRRWVAGVVGSLKSRSSIIAWAVQDAPQTTVAYRDADFAAYLRRVYGTPASLSAFWSTQVAAFDGVTQAFASQVNRQVLPFFSRPQLDVALFRWQALTDLLSLWADAVRTADPTRPLLTGALTDYKSVAAVPGAYDGIVTALLPGAVEVDALAHNPQSVDIARNANRFLVVPVLTTQASPSVAAPVRRWRAWVRTAALHGAGGFGLADWAPLRKDAELRDQLKEAMGGLLTSDLWERQPTPSVAVLYTPIAPGQVVNGSPLYGFATDFPPNEPSDLIYGLRLGTRYGQVDYLTPASLTSVNLAHYGVILAPHAMLLGNAGMEALRAYVNAGGVMVADIGLGLGDGGRSMRDVPQPLQPVFGVLNMQRYIAGAQNIRVLRAHPLFLSFTPGLVTSGNADGRSVSGPLGMSRMMSTAVPLALVRAGLRGQVRPYSCTVTVQSFGRGFGVFAPVRLWANWLPGHRGWDEFHGDLMQRSAMVVRVNSRRLIADEVEVAALREAVAVMNYAAEARYVWADTVGCNSLLFDPGINIIQPNRRPSAGAVYPRLGATPLAATQQRVVHHYVGLHLAVKPESVVVSHLIPVQVVPEEQSAAAVLEYSERRVRLRVYGIPGQARMDDSGGLQLEVKRAADAVIVVADGTYPVGPGTRHIVTHRRSYGGRGRTRKLVTADERGRIVYSGRFRADEVTIELAK